MRRRLGMTAMNLMRSQERLKNFFQRAASAKDA
jgi:hypothetical protein